MPSDQDQSQSDLSHVSLGDNQGKMTPEGRQFSDSESSDDNMEETTDSLQDDLSSLEKQPSSLPANSMATSSENNQDEKPTSTAGVTTASQSEESTVGGKETDCNKSDQAETQEKAVGDGLAQASVSKKEKTTLSDLAEGTKTDDPKEQNLGQKSLKNKKESVGTTKSSLDQNANSDPVTNQTETTKKAKSQDDQKQKRKAQEDQKQNSAPLNVILVHFLL